MSRWWWMVGGLLVSFVVHAQSDTAINEWLERMQHAVSSLNYSGVIVLDSAQSMDSLQIRHANINQQEYESIEKLNGQAQQMIRHNDDLYCAHSEAIGRHLPLRNPLYPQAALVNTEFPYHFTLGALRRMAGRMAQQILLQPTSNDRYSAALWLDAETGLLLGSELLDEDERLVRAQYVQIEFDNNLTLADFTSSMPSHKIASTFSNTESTLENSREPDWLPRWLPEGFKLYFMHQHADQAVRLMYFDGLVSFSLFIDEYEPNVKPMERRWGATGAVVLAVGENAEARRVTAVGELPAATLARIAQSVTSVDHAIQETKLP